MAEELLSADEAIEKALATATEAEVEETEDEQEGKEQTTTEEETKETEPEETEDSKPDKGKTKKESTETEDDTEPGSGSNNDEEPDESPEIDEKTANALALWEALEGDEALEVLQQIAGKAGLRLVSSTTETKPDGKTKAETKISTLEVAKQIFGKDYEFIAEKVALVLDKVLEEKVEKPLRASKEEQEVRTLNAEVSTFLKTNKDAAKHSRKIAALINEMPPRPGVNLQTYLGRIYKLVSGDAAETTRVRKVVDKISENAKRTSTRSSEVATQSVKKGSKLPSIDEALDAAAKGIKFDFEE